jgi:hypothetical protein
MDGLPTSMIGPCQEAKSPPDALRRSAGVIFSSAARRKINEPGVRRRAEFYYQQLDALRVLRQQVRRDLLAESKKHKAWKLLCQIPAIRTDRVEEGSTLRRPTSETTNSLRVSERFRSIPEVFSGGGRGVLETLWFESESQLVS